MNTTNAPAQDIRCRLESMITANNWTGVIDIIQEIKQQQGQDTRQRQLHTALHLVCRRSVWIDVVKELIKVGGGRDYVWEEDRWGRTALHCACDNNASIEVVKELIEQAEGGQDFVWQTDSWGRTALHCACQFNASIEVVKELIVVAGGWDYIWEKSKTYRTALHFACRFKASIDVLELLIDYGRGDVLTPVNNENKTPLQELLITEHRWEDEEEKRADIEKASFLISKGIELQIGGGYSIGGLFNNNTNEEVRDEIYQRWDDRVLHALEQAMTQPRNQHLRILQALIALIANKAPPRIIESAISTFGLWYGPLVFAVLTTRTMLMTLIPYFI